MATARTGKSLAPRAAAKRAARRLRSAGYKISRGKPGDPPRAIDVPGLDLSRPLMEGRGKKSK